MTRWREVSEANEFAAKTGQPLLEGPTPVEVHRDLLEVIGLLGTVINQTAPTFSGGMGPYLWDSIDAKWRRFRIDPDEWTLAMLDQLMERIRAVANKEAAEKANARGK